MLFPVLSASFDQSPSNPSVGARGLEEDPDEADKLTKGGQAEKPRELRKSSSNGTNSSDETIRQHPK